MSAFRIIFHITFSKKGEYYSSLKKENSCRYCIRYEYKVEKHTKEIFIRR